jgi:heptosyltransferase II
MHIDLPAKPKILVVTVNWLGDAVMTFPAFGALKSAFPGCQTAVMAVPRLEGLYEMNPDVDEVITFDERRQERSLTAKIKFIRRLKAKHFDTVFCIHRSFTRILICALAGIPIRYGYGRWKTSFLLTESIKPAVGLIHRQDHYLGLFKGSGMNTTSLAPKVTIPDTDAQWAQNLCVDLRKKAAHLVGINPSANWKLKRWPLEKYSFLADKLSREARCKIVLIGSGSDKPLADACQANMKEPCLNLCGTTTIKQLAAILKKLDLFISNDSGPAHLAAAEGVKTIVLFGPTDPQITAPRGPAVTIIQGDSGCTIPCYNGDCRQNKCMDSIDPAKVFAASLALLSG